MKKGQTLFTLEGMMPPSEWVGKKAESPYFQAGTKHTVGERVSLRPHRCRRPPHTCIRRP